MKKGQSPRIITRQGCFDPKFMHTIVFKRSGVVQMLRLDKGKTINHDSYIEETLKPLVKDINAQRPESGCKDLKFQR